MTLTGDDEYSKYFAEVSLREVVAIPDCAGCDQKVPDDVPKPEAPFLHGVLVVVETVALVLKEVNGSCRPAEEPHDVGDQLEANI